jgi:hypothetical protein
VKRIVFIAMIAGSMPAQPELSAFAGRWRGHCGWGANVKRNREHYRIVRISGPNRIEALEWAAATDFIVDPPSRPREVVLFEPKRETFIRESDLRFRSKTGVIEFVRQGGKLEMLPGEGDACTGLGGEYTLAKDDAFGAWRPSFPCDRATQPRESHLRQRRVIDAGPAPRFGIPRCRRPYPGQPQGRSTRRRGAETEKRAERLVGQSTFALPGFRLCIPSAL